MGVLVYNGLRSTDYHVVVEHPPVFKIPERDYEKVHVPGRNGDVIIDNGSYQNSSAKYDICFGSYFRYYPEMVYKVSRWLHSAKGQYARLEDSYDPDHFRLAAYLEENEFENIMFRAGRATVEFDCKPQRFFKSGEYPITISKPSDILNPSFEAAKPIVTVRGAGSGTLRIGNSTITISDITDGMIIDSDLEDCYAGVLNKNPVTTIVNGFPILSEGKTEISFSEGITSVEITPRWWEL